MSPAKNVRINFRRFERSIGIRKGDLCGIHSPTRTEKIASCVPRGTDHVLSAQRRRHVTHTCVFHVPFLSKYFISHFGHPIPHYVSYLAYGDGATENIRYLVFLLSRTFLFYRASIFARSRVYVCACLCVPIAPGVRLRDLCGPYRCITRAT